MQQYQYFPKSKNMPIYHTVYDLSELNMQKVSTFYHFLNFLWNFCNSDKLSVLKQQHIELQNKHGKGYPWHFIENKDAEHYSK